MSMIKAENIYFNYPDGTKALENLNFKIEKGEFIGILGANGSGKTTLLKILNRLLKPTEGKVYYENINIFDMNNYFTKVNTVFQNPDDQLFSSTVAEDIAFGPNNMGLKKEEVTRRIDEALDLVEMTEFKNKFIHNLSFGQKKRVCIAGVLVMKPEIILLDEPTAALDPIGVSLIMHLLKKLNKERITMIMATHFVDLIPIFIDRAIVLKKGEIIIEGSPKKIFADPNLIRSANLRLPHVGHLFEILKKKDNMDLDNLPLTIGDARREINKLSS